MCATRHERQHDIDVECLSTSNHLALHRGHTRASVMALELTGVYISQSRSQNAGVVVSISCSISDEGSSSEARRLRPQKYRRTDPASE